MSDLSSVVASADVVFFDSPGCPYCARAQTALSSAGISFRKVPISAYRQELHSATGKTSAPSVWVKGTYVGGCNDGTERWHGVLPLLRSGEFQKMLAADANGHSTPQAQVGIEEYGQSRCSLL